MDKKTQVLRDALRRLVYAYDRRSPQAKGPTAREDEARRIARDALISVGVAPTYLESIRTAEDEAA